MSGSNWDAISAAIRVAVLALVAFGWAWMIWNISADYAERRVRAESRAAQYAQSTEERVKRACGGVEAAALAKCITEEVKASREQERSEHDLQAQQDMADWAFWVMVLGIGSLTLAAVGIWYVRETLNATRETVDETRRIGEAQVRAYLTGVSAEVGFTQDGCAVVRCTLKNAGSSPARAVKCRVSISFDTAEGYTIFDQPYGDIGAHTLDISAGAEATLDSHVVADGNLWVNGRDRWYITADVHIEANDVFGQAIVEEETFFGTLHNAPTINSWIKLDRAGRFGPHQGERDTNQPHLPLEGGGQA